MLSQPPVWLIVLAFLAAIGPLIIGHELGHYWVARWFGVGAETFSIGFGNEVRGWTDKRGTRWKIGWLPLGGYVKFVGDADPVSAAPDDVTPSQRKHSFQHRPPWQRFLIVLAGPATNFLIAIMVFAILFAAYGIPRTPSLVSAIRPGSAAEHAGIRPGDQVIDIAGRATPSFEDLFAVVVIRPGEQVAITLRRGGQTIIVPARLDAVEQADRFGQHFRIGQLGVLGGRPGYVRVPATQLLPEAVAMTVKSTQGMIDSLWQIVSGRRSLKELGGPLRMAQIAGQTASLGLFDFVGLIAFFSINLGFINLLPVPMLDGGHLVLYSIEAVRRRPVSERVVEWTFRGGLAFLLALLLVATFNDLGFFGLWNGVERLIG
jgi:regulator of sigma E protease